MKVGAWMRPVGLVGLVHAPFWSLQPWLAINRPWVNLDLILALLLMCRWPRVGAVALMFGWLLDGLVGQSLMFHFQSLGEYLRAARFVGELHWRDFVSPTTLATGAAFVGALIALRRAGGPHRREAPWLVLLVLVSALADGLNGSSTLSGRDTRLVAPNLAGSPAAMTVLRLLNDRHAGLPTQLPRGSSAVDVSGLERWIDEHPEGAVVIVLVESMGLHRLPEAQDWLAAHLASPAIDTRYERAAVKLPFHGATTAAELRLLCGLAGSYRRLSPAQERDCLPARLTRKGWSVHGLHGFSGAMFDRAEWWPRIGIRDAQFKDSLVSVSQPQCGAAFRGLCDANMVARAFDLAAAPRQFVYLLTLNTHLPLEPGPLTPEARQACDAFRANDDVCRLLDRSAMVLAQVRSLAERATRPTFVLVLGDHAPPFSVIRSREQFDGERVPVFWLRPRD